MKIPERLEGWRFILLAGGTKRPIEDNWTKGRNYTYGDPKLLKHIGNGGNYGVLCGQGHIVIDADIDETKNIVEKNFPRTFTIRTPHGTHFYFNCNLDAPIRLYDKDNKNVGDIQGEGKQVVGPGCTVDGRTYEVVDDVSIAEISEKKLVDVFSDYIAGRSYSLAEEERLRGAELGVGQEIPIGTVVPLEGLKKRGNEYFGSHPIHGSDTGRNFWVNTAKNTWFCFRHSSGGGPLAWLAVQEELIECADAVPGALRGEKFLRVLEKARNRGLIRRENGRLEEVKITDKIKKLMQSGSFYGCFLESVGRRVKHDQPMKELLILTGISAYSDDPLNVFLKGPTSTGKTFPATEVMGYFPEKDAWMLGGLSPTALIHSYGEWDQENSKFIIDLAGKILVFLEAPHLQTYQMLRPVLSHDKYEMDYKFTDKTKGGALRTKTVTIRGWPACVFCSSDATYIADLSTRGITHTPEIDPEKWKAAIKRQAVEASRPWSLAREKDEVQLIKDGIKIVKNRIIEHRVDVTIPYAEELAEIYQVTMARDMRDFKRLLSLIKQSALAHCHRRLYMEDAEGKQRIIATERDYEIAGGLFLNIVETTQVGIPGDVLQFYWEVLLKREVWTYEEAQREGRKLMNIRVGGRRFKERYIYPLLDVGLVVGARDPEDKRRKLIQVEKRRDTTIFGLKPFREFFPEENAKKWLQNSANNITSDTVTYFFKSPNGSTHPLSSYISLIYNGKNKGVLSELKQKEPDKEETVVSRRISERLHKILKLGSLSPSGLATHFSKDEMPALAAALEHLSQRGKLILAPDEDGVMCWRLV